MGSEIGDDGWERVAEVLVVAEAEAIASHVHPTAEASFVAVERDEARAFVGGEDGRSPGVAPLPEALFDGPPVELGQPIGDRHRSRKTI